jgi:cyclopropane fatty-acyl-phospholipid synthase-like methyltransferase
MKIKTEYPVCFESPDYYNPVGAINDDNSNEKYADELELKLGKKLNYLELGCAGGTFIDLLISKGHNAFGIDGTDHPIKIGRPAWVKYFNDRLFTCDLSKPFEVIDFPKFDVISAWEFMEHIPTDSIDFLLSKIYELLDDDGIVIFGVSMAECSHHQSVFKQEIWNDKYFSKLYETNEYYLINKYREDYIGNHNSFFTILKKKPNMKNLASSLIKEHEQKEFLKQ